MPGWVPNTMHVFMLHVFHVLRWRAGALRQVPTCSDTNGITAGTPAVTCPDGWSRKADFATTELTGINNVNNNWRDRCCDQVITQCLQAQ